jgi:diguanylate cyclase (GGDEF)-like protein
VQAGSQSREDLAVAFWLSHLRVGFSVFVGEAVAVFVYLRVTPHGLHRDLLTAIAVGSACIGAVSFFGLRKIAQQPWRHGFSLSWSLAAGWILALCVRLDGGLDSPLLYLVLLPVIYAALAFRPRAAIACGISALAEVVTIRATNGVSMVPRETLFMVVAVVGGMSALAVDAALYRTRLQESEVLLTEELAKLADTDGLTGCLNRRAFHARLAVEIDRAVRHDRPLCLVVADIDDFKAVNDNLGHPIGDEALALVGAALRDELRSTDVAGRLGGDEFGVIIADTTLEGAQTQARRIGQTLDRDASVVSLSLGVAALEPSEPTAHRLTRDADRALYHVKRTGRHGIAATAPNGMPVRLPVERPVSARGGFA